MKPVSKIDNTHMISLLVDGCYIAYHYRGAKIASAVTTYVAKGESEYDIHAVKYDGNLEANDLFIISGVGDLAHRWEIVKVARMNNIEILEFYPNIETLSEKYGEYLI